MTNLAKNTSSFSNSTVPHLRLVGEEETNNKKTATNNNKKKGRKSEVYPFELEDVKKILNYFRENEQWTYYLIFVFSCNMARRIGDTLSLTWEHIYYSDGRMRPELLEIIEDKTDKLANPRINRACREAIELYLEKTNCNPAENNYQEYVFKQLTGNYKGRVITDDSYRKALKKAAKAVGIEYNVGTHSARKTFGKYTKMLHPNDYNVMELLQTIYNHSDVKTTNSYIGLTKEQTNKYYDDFGECFTDYVIGDKQFLGESNKPVVTIDTNDLRDIITKAYQAGMNNATEIDAVKHIEAINKIMELVEGAEK